MNRRSFLASSLALAAPVSAPAAPKLSEAEYVLCGDSMAYVMGPTFRAAGAAYARKVDVWAKGGSSLRQWLRKKWFQRVVREHPKARVLLVSLGVNCTRVERPKLAEDVSTAVNLVNDWMYDHFEEEPDYQGSPAVAWLLPPPLRMDTRYLVDAVAKSEVFAFGPGPLPLESDGIHPTHEGVGLWVNKIAETMWE